MLSAVLQAKGKNNMFYLCVQCDKLITHIEVEIRLAGQEGNGGEVCQKSLHGRKPRDSDNILNI